ncbi:lysosomal Pro-X carboxypeptidase-like [Ornithodoros turicata]|uniref:lysosomal Pro-X carboxypeptidase-like n=1 Tax=Ornithodoros turicata TaxID=34597 RepID=UPI003139F9D0
MEGLRFATFLSALLAVAIGYQYETRYFTTKVDHFSYANNDTFEVRYLIADQHWNSARGGPIFMYTGNEGGIEHFAENTGVMWDWAPEFEALLVFAEHRYYGKSMPYGNRSYEDLKHLGYLTVEQTLADYADLVAHLKATLPGAAQSPVISFGGSYGGMLAAWFRMKYPHVTIAALTSGAPVLQFQGLTECGVFDRVLTKAFQSASSACTSAIRKSWDVMEHMASTDKGAQELGQVFKMCHVLSPSIYTVFRSWVYNIYVMMSMMNYPYPTNFVVPVPAYPVRAACKYLDAAQSDNRTLVEGVYKAISIFTNYTGSLNCHETSGLTGNLGGDAGWGFQSCTELVAPKCSDGVHDMFFPSAWNLTVYSEGCRQTHGVTPDVNKMIKNYGGRDILSASNIIFSNGDLDPWSAGGFLESVSDSLVALVVEGGAHHDELRAEHPNDSDSVRTVRAKEKEYIRLWLHQHRRGT